MKLFSRLFNRTKTHEEEVCWKCKADDERPLQWMKEKTGRYTTTQGYVCKVCTGEVTPDKLKEYLDWAEDMMKGR